MTRKKNTRNPQGGGSIDQLKDGRWRGRYTAGRDPVTGKQVQKAVWGKTQKEALMKLQQITTTINDGTYTEPSKITVGEWLDIWVNEYIRNRKYHTKRSYEGHIRNYLKPALGQVRLQALTPAAIQAFFNRLQSDTCLSAKTIKNIHTCLHSALSTACEEEYLQSNPATNCRKRLPKVTKPPIKPFENDQLNAFLQAIENHRWESLYFVTLFTGLRQSEVLGLTWDNINFDNGTIFACKQLLRAKGVYQFDTLKNGKTKTITPTPDVMDELKKQRRRQTEWKLRADFDKPGSMWDNTGGVLSGSPWDDHTGLVFTNEIGGHLSHYTVYKDFKKIVDTLGIPEKRFHDTRHTYAVVSLQAGDDVKTLQENMGIHSAAFVLDTYGHVTEQMKRDSANRMHEFINGIKKL